MIFDENNPVFIKKKYDAMFLSGIITCLLFIILSATDSILAGIFVGEDGVSSIAVTAPLASMISSVISVFISGCRFIYPEELGKYDKKKAQNYFSTSMTSAVILSTIFLILILFYGERYFVIYDISDSVLGYAKQYFRFYKYVYVLSPFVIYISQMVYADGDTQINTIGSATYAVLNLLFSILGAVLWGMAGIGLGTLLSGVICLAVNCIHFFKTENTLKYRFHFSIAEQIKLFKYSFMESTFDLFSGLNGIIINWFLCSHFGSQYLAVNSVIGYALGMTSVFRGLSEAMIPILNTYRGERNPDGVKKILCIVLERLGLVSVILTTAVFIAAPLFPAAFSITSPELKNACITGIRIISTTYIFVGFMSVMPTYYNAQGKTILSTVVARFKDSIFYVLFFVLFGALFGTIGAWIGIALSPVAATVLMIAIVGLKYGRDNLFLFPVNEGAIKSWDLILNNDTIIELRNRVEAFLRANDVPENTVLKIAFLIEEVYGLVLENNKENDHVMAEATAMTGSDIEIILRDDGRVFDNTDEDAHPTSFRAYVVSVFEQRIEQKNNALSLSCNRSRFTFKNARME